MSAYDYLIVGAGLYGSVFARQMLDRGKKVLVVEKRGHVAGNIYTERVGEIDVHKYGAHIFHTSDAEVWAYVQQFAHFLPFINQPIANYKGEIYNLPFNMNTFARLWGVARPEQAQAVIEEQRRALAGKTPANLEEQAISLVGTDIYEKLIKGYTEKQWGAECKDLPAFIIRRLPVRFTYDNNYFNDLYQGVPEEGYTALVERLLEGADVRLDTDYLADRAYWDAQADTIVYTGPVDAFYEFRYGALDYRTLRFEEETLLVENYQGVAVMNFTDRETPYTRIIEHKHFTKAADAETIITREYPAAWQPGDEPFYPLNDEKNCERFAQYETLMQQEARVRFGGRLGRYRYYDMHQVVRLALDDAAKEC
ncbi:MAG: UDP-galactopyranose mutase [Clostridiales bacterium]|nr:UDP-galactopyranose mutase [Clostridiales bacterium]